MDREPSMAIGWMFFIFGIALFVLTEFTGFIEFIAGLFE